MPPSFKKRLAETAITDRTTIPFRVESYYNKPTLHLAPLSSENKPFLNDVLRRGHERAGKEVETAKVQTAEDVAIERQRDAETLTKHSVRGWDGLYDDEDNLVPYTPENAAAFLAALAETHPGEITKMVSRAHDIASYSKAPSMRPEVVGKNS